MLLTRPKIFFSFGFIIILTLYLTKCAKTNDVDPILIDDINSNDSTNTIFSEDTIYINLNINGFILNEVLYDPPLGIAGDANNDGIRDPQQDEFVEFVNSTDSCIDISKCKIFDNDSFNTLIPKHKFPDKCFVNPTQAVVVFGGPQGIDFDSLQFGDALVFSASESLLNLNNSGDKMFFTDSLNNTIIEFDITPLSNNPDESYTRNPDITGFFEQHSEVSSTLFSPGTRADGTPF